MKLRRILMLLVWAFIIFLVYILFSDNIVSSDLEKNITADYLNNKGVFVEFVSEYKYKEGMIKKEEYDKNSELLSKLFNELDYEFVRFNNNSIFFCKGYKGMSGIGLLYTEDVSSVETIKDKIIDELEKGWFIFSEHYL